MKKFTALATAALFASVLSAEAATVPPTGPVSGTVISPAGRLDLSVNATESNDVQVYSEKFDVAVGAGDVSLDYLVGTNVNVGDTFTGVNDYTGGPSLAAGMYNSFLVQLDSIGNGGISDVVVDFGQTIVGLIVSNGSSNSNTPQLLNLSDAVFGSASAYATNLGRRAESGDTFTLTNASSLKMSLYTNYANVDNIRVITQVAPVPLPASLSLMLAGFGGLLVMRRRRRS